ncbi:crotonobetainyl-CoA:carnitine CoA-transferase CaiB-like acyl-CoA transferase [Lacibacter cauensis]|uniref:Crotonobetainyl-CoA:carnitine CoA-transferase CaiB-like acyl-CoA transferase n=1 Tax=Lacibacter cauensis TaxID=510947 RepID=A0A562SWE6_9BACT|nr:CaiB/BaiF CoA-transferase family protein [Lacibacter cauensis]TWI85126.1 crotonobetainyl-CoA:carnitine CoA-transferase CaiB-like acyl-CoA transferase [Lacibacter cauensis]
MMNLPLQGIVVLEFCQYLSGPSASLRLADLGARVIKIERPGTGDAGRKLAIKDLWVDDSSLLFHTINRNKESFTADLKNEEDKAVLYKLIAKADVLIHNFRPDVMGKNGLDYATVQQLNPKLVYAEISGYGKKGPWKNKPGQDLLVQSMAGLAYTTGNGSNGPVPFGISITDIMAGSQLVQGILGALIRRQKTGKGALIEVSLLESLLDFQFELLTTYFTSKQQPKRSVLANGQPLLGAPYGIYQTADGYLALAMMDLHQLADTIGCAGLKNFAKEDAFAKRDDIKRLLVDHLVTKETNFWLGLLQDAGLWAMEVMNWDELTEHEAYRVLQMEQEITVNNRAISTTRCPIRIDGELLLSTKPAPQLGEQNEAIRRELVAGS